MQIWQVMLSARRRPGQVLFFAQSEVGARALACGQVDNLVHVVTLTANVDGTCPTDITEPANAGSQLLISGIVLCYWQVALHGGALIGKGAPSPSKGGPCTCSMVPRQTSDVFQFCKCNRVKPDTVNPGNCSGLVLGHVGERVEMRTHLLRPPN